MMGQGYTPNPGPTSSYTPNNNLGSGNNNEMLGQVQAWSSKAEDFIEAYTQVSTLYSLM
jgi:hypothetical protein